MTAGAAHSAGRVVEIRPNADAPDLLRGTRRKFYRRICLRLDLNAGTATWAPEAGWRDPIVMRLPGATGAEGTPELVRCAIVDSVAGIGAITDANVRVIVFLDRDDRALAWSGGIPPHNFNRIWSLPAFDPLVAAGVPVTEEAVRDNWQLHKKYPPAVKYLRWMTWRGVLWSTPVLFLLLCGALALSVWV